VIAIEVDPPLVHYLRQKFRDPIAEGRLEVIEGDVLEGAVCRPRDHRQSAVLHHVADSGKSVRAGRPMDVGCVF